jgi:hypothetical protein
MGILDLFNSSSDNGDRLAIVAENDTLREEIGFQGAQIHELQEDMLRVSDAFDNIGWAPLTTTQAVEIPLRTVKKIAHLSRSLQALNPFIKRGVEARVGYIWGRGVLFDNVESISKELNSNRKKLFTAQAYQEFERVLATDGNAFLALPIDNNFKAKNAPTAFRIPLHQIISSVSNPLDHEDIWFYRRAYTIESTNATTGSVSANGIQKYYISISYYKQLKEQGKAIPRNFAGIGIEQNFVLQHTAVNRQVGWRWGVPDIMPVIFWAKAYKEYLEDNANLVKAYSRLAWEVKAPSAGGVNAAAAQVMRPPTRDPITGEIQNVGGTVFGSTGASIQPFNATGSTVDFAKGAAMAAAIAAGLEVPLIVLTSDAGSANRSGAETLDLPTLKAMETRQNLHTERFLEIFEFWGANIIPESNNSVGESEISEAKVGDPVPDATKPGTPPPAKANATSTPDTAVVTWPQIETDTTKDRITAIGTAVELGIIYKQEARREALNTLGIAPYKDWDDLPTMADDPAAQESSALQTKIAVANGQGMVTEATPNTPAVAKQGVSGGVAAKGKAQTTPNAARTARKKDTNNA